MRLLVLVWLAPSVALFGQARSGARPSASPAHRTTAPSPGIVSPRTAAPARPVLTPGGYGYVVGYYPAPLYYGVPAPADASAGYAYGYAPPPDAGAAGPPPAGSVPAYYGADPGGQGYPSVIINPNYTPQVAHPVMRDYSYLPSADAPPAYTNDAAAAQPAPAPSVIFLIAMKDHTIYPAVAYWVQNGTLNYIDRQGTRNQVPLTQVDRDFSVQLNKDRKIDFALPEVNSN